MPSVMPERIRVRLPYSSWLSGTSGANTVLEQVRGNGAYDPDSTGVGHQPNGFDQWAAFYQKYRVLGSRITVTAYSTSDAIISVFPSNTSSLATTKIHPTLEESNCVYTQTNAYSAGDPIVNEMTTSVVTGISPQAVLDEDNLGALVSAVPAVQWYWNISAQHPDEASATSVNMTYTVEYDIVFYSRVELPQS